jgi:uncharacterized protein (TIGR03437 family)
MCSSARAALFFILIAASVTAAPNKFVARYVPIGLAGSANVLAVDASGNFFVISTVQEPSGRQQIRAIKTDPRGNVLASFDFGGSSRDIPLGAAVDPQGNMVIVGTTYSPDFPVVGLSISKTSIPAGFIVKLDAQLTKIIFSTLLGGSQGRSYANAVALDAAANIYVAGSTEASDYPVTPGAFQTVGPSGYTMGFGAPPAYAFVTEISSDNKSLISSTFFGSPDTNCNGGSACIGAYGITSANAIAVDSTGAVVIGGNTTATKLPITPGTVGQQCLCLVNNEGTDNGAGFLAKFAAGGKQLIWATYIVAPGSPWRSSYHSNMSIASVGVDTSGNIVVGGTAPDGLVLTDGALQSSYPGGNPAAYANGPFAGFVAKLNSSATSYLFSTYFGGNIAFGSPNGVTALTLDSQGDIWLTGGSAPSELPFPGSIPLLGSTYVAELSADGSSVLDAITAPAGASGQAIVITPNGSPAALGTAGSLLLSLPGQPASLVGVANSAGIQVSSSVAPYELVALYGVGLGPAKALGGKVVNGALTSSLGGVQVLFNNVAAPLLYVGPNQINAIVPSSVFGQDTAIVQVITPNGTLTGPSLSVVPSEPEVFQNGPPMPAGGAAVALNQDGSLNSASNPAGGTSIMTVWATGAGLDNSILGGDGIIVTNPDTPLLPVSVLNASYSDVSGLDSLEVLYAGNAPLLVKGALQVNFRLPENLFDIYQLACQLQIGTAVSSRFSIYVTP